MIRSFADAATEDLYHGRQKGRIRRFPPDIVPIVLRKLDMLDAASELRDLMAPPGNRLEALKADLEGFHSIRINQQWRVVFRWSSGGADDVSVRDYHYGGEREEVVDVA